MYNAFLNITSDIEESGVPVIFFIKAVLLTKYYLLFLFVSSILAMEDKITPGKTVISKIKKRMSFLLVKESFSATFLLPPLW